MTRANAERLDDSPPPAQSRKTTICRLIKDAQLSIEYEQKVSGATRHAHMKLLSAYFQNFRQEKVCVWVPDAEDDECEFGVYANSKVVILTRGDAANIAFGQDWREEHIRIAQISWKISEDEYKKTVQDYNSTREWARRAAAHDPRHDPARTPSPAAVGHINWERSAIKNV